MASWRKGRVTHVLERRDDLLRVTLDVDGDELEAVGFPFMLGPVEIDDLLVVNTTGVDLDLGTGGVSFILWNLDERTVPQPGTGHIIKLRYTPWQTEVLAAEAPESPHHDLLAEASDIAGTPVVVCGLHSQMAAAAAGVRAAAPRARVGYLMTDGAALPLAWSDLVRSLEEAGLVEVTCTSGHAFGGDLEAVNVYSGLVALRHAGRADAIVVSMGPGVVGTQTPLGFTAIEQGPVLDAVAALGGHPIASLRISFVDPRRRHTGVSHHSLTTLGLAAREEATVVVPALAGDAARVVDEQLSAAGLEERHRLVVVDGSPGLELLRAEGVHPTSMGHPMDETPELFLAAAAAGRLAGEML